MTKTNQRARIGGCDQDRLPDFPRQLLLPFPLRKRDFDGVPPPSLRRTRTDGKFRGSFLIGGRRFGGCTGTGDPAEAMHRLNSAYSFALWAGRHGRYHELALLVRDMRLGHMADYRLGDPPALS